MNILDLVPTWINVIRDPVDRFESSFSYQREKHRWKHSKRRRLKPPKEWFEKNITTCILYGDPECQYNPESDYPKQQILTFFCGSSPECKQVGSKAALQKGILIQIGKNYWLKLFRYHIMSNKKN